MNKKYNVSIIGIKKGLDVTETSNKLANLFKISQKKATNLLFSKSTIKSNIDKNTAEKYANTLISIGVKINVTEVSNKSEKAVDKSSPNKYEIKGVNGQITLTKNRVIISRNGFLGFMAQGFAGNKEIPIKNIIAVQFKEAGSVLSGFIQFTLPGAIEKSGGVFNATEDENTVVFIKDQQSDFLEIKRYIDSFIDDEPLALSDLSISDIGEKAEPKKTFSKEKSQLKSISMAQEKAHKNIAEFSQNKLFTLKGSQKSRTCTLDVYDDRVEMTSKKLFSNQAVKIIEFSEIVEVNIKEANFFVNGFVNFRVSTSPTVTGIMSASQDENTFIFMMGGNKNKDILKIKNYIDLKISKEKNNTTKKASAVIGKTQSVVKSDEKNRTTAAVLAFLLGGLGVHKFYLGKSGLGIVYLLFCWTFIPAILALIDFVILLTMSDETFAQTYNS